jgi:hypothetical protein
MRSAYEIVSVLLRPIKHAKNSRPGAELSENEEAPGAAECRDEFPTTIGGRLVFSPSIDVRRLGSGPLSE